jgi:hypothetical protein
MSITTHMVAAGETPPGSTDWKQYSPEGIYVDVDTSDAGFGSRTVVYTCSLGGDSRHWTTTGGSCIYNAARKSFRVYVRHTGPITPEQANSWKWHINWMGIEVS